MNKPNCYACIHRGDIPGDAHSICRHPATGLKAGADMFDAMVSMLLGAASEARVVSGSRELEIVGNAHGIRNGWFLWPANFDPVWLENCTGFEARQTEEQVDRKQEKSE